MAKKRYGYVYTLLDNVATVLCEHLLRLRLACACLASVLESACMQSLELNHLALLHSYGTDQLRCKSIIQLARSPER